MLAAILADIAVGKTGGAELFFLIAAILAGIGGVIAWTIKAIWATCVAAAICLECIGWVLL
jgi:hypothetical protein